MFDHFLWILFMLYLKTRPCLSSKDCVLANNFFITFFNPQHHKLPRTDLALTVSSENTEDYFKMQIFQ